MKKIKLLMIMLASVMLMQAQTNTYQISAMVLTNNYQNFVPNYPVIVIDSAAGAFGGVAVYNYTTDSSGQFTDSLTVQGPTGTLFFLAPDSCGFTAIAIGYSPNSPSTLATAGLVLCNNIVNTGTNCNYSVNALPVAGQPLMVAFNSNATNGSTYSWDFGDGNSSSVPAPFHTYAQPGTYYYCLTVDSCQPVCDSITVIQTTGCDPFFIPQVNGNTVDIFPWLLTGQFVAIVDWGDAQVDTFTPQNIPVLPNNISHTYAAPGNYQICFTHSNASIGCSNTYCDTVTVTSATPLQCNAEFIIDTVNSQPGTVVVWNTSSITGGSPAASANFYWDFGDGNSSTLAYPTHQYQNAGSYAICLTLTSIDSTALGVYSCTSTFCDSLTVDQNGNIIYKGALVGWTLVVLNPATIGVDEDLFAQASFYPNPATNNVIIDIPTGIDDAQIEIYSTNGQLVKQHVLNTGVKNDLNVSDLSAGMYILNLELNDKTKQYKFIKQ